MMVLEVILAITAACFAETPVFKIVGPGLASHTPETAAITGTPNDERFRES
jgi:hypothetical protein